MFQLNDLSVIENISMSVITCQVWMPTIKMFF
jgi:hypothetical protein